MTDLDHALNYTIHLFQDASNRFHYYLEFRPLTLFFFSYKYHQLSGQSVIPQVFKLVHTLHLHPLYKFVMTLIIDSGASDHMTSKNSQFLYYSSTYNSNCGKLAYNNSRN